MAENLQSFKVADQELSSATKFNNLVQAIEDAVNSLDNSNIDAAAAILVSKLAAGADGEVVTTVAGVPVWQASGAAATVPAGAVTPYAGPAAPSGWLLCDGAAVSRTTFAALFAVVGTTYGTGDGSSTFNVPDMRGRGPVGKGTHANVDTLGENDGVVVGNRRPQHRHTPHSHTIPVVSGGSGAVGQVLTSAQVNFQSNAPTSSVDGGSGNANDSLDAPAYLVLNYILKT